MEKQACRRCDRTGRWEEGDYSHCLYTNDITRVLYTFVLVSWGRASRFLRMLMLSAGRVHFSVAVAP